MPRKKTNKKLKRKKRPLPPPRHAEAPSPKPKAQTFRSFREAGDYLFNESLKHPRI